jgi:pyruvate dehydrogenase E2 component (dihydrolipoyllysine-residue acetyltransferase)
MPVDVLMPKLSDTMEEGKILRWLKKPGDRVALGDVLAEVETDKADMELEAEAEGVLSKVLVDEGGSVAVGGKIAVLVDGSGSTEAVPPRPAAREQAEPERPAAQDRPAPPTHGSGGPRPTTPPRSTVPPAQRVAAPRPPAPRAARTVPPPPHAPAPAKREELSKIRRTVARRMAQSKREVPHFYMMAEFDMAECARLKASLADLRSDVKVSYTHLLLRAVALALVEHPRINARYAQEDAVEFSEGVHLGIAVALEQGLIVPVLHDCETKGVFAIAAEASALVERVRTGKAEGGDLSGGTFTVSNLGMYPIEEFAAVINPPQAAVLATGAVAERPLVRDGVLTARRTVRATLSSDHRVIDGAEAAAFLQTLRRLLENPVRLVL